MVVLGLQTGSSCGGYTKWKWSCGKGEEIVEYSMSWMGKWKRQKKMSFVVVVLCLNAFCFM